MKKWRDVRAKAVREGRLDEKKVQAHKARMIADERAHKLAELRSHFGLRQEDVAERLHVSQSRVSRIERGDIDTAQVSTLRAYAQALGGDIEIALRVGDDRIPIS